MPLTSDPYRAASQEDRCGPRTRLTIPATLRASGGRAFQSVVHDLSISGFSATSINRMYEGQMCWLTLPGLESLRAEVVWWDNCLVGCALSELLSPIVHDNIIRRYSHTEGVAPKPRWPRMLSPAAAMFHVKHRANRGLNRARGDLTGV